MSRSIAEFPIELRSKYMRNVISLGLKHLIVALSAIPLFFTMLNAALDWNVFGEYDRYMILMGVALFFGVISITGVPNLENVLSLKVKRLIAVISAIPFLFSILNIVLNWNMFGDYDQLVMFMGVALFFGVVNLVGITRSEDEGRSEDG